MTGGAARVGVPPRIKTLSICDFRAFPGPEPYVFALNGKNLLIYGENGSGKSTIFHALNEFFSIALKSPDAYRERLAGLRNSFSGLALDDGYIEVEFDDRKPAARWDNQRHPVDVSPTSDLRVVNASFEKAVFDYRSLLDTNYRWADSDVNLFEPCVNVLLRDYPVSHGGTQMKLFDVWRNMNAYFDRAQLRAKEIGEINALAASFNGALREALTRLRPLVDPMLDELGWEDLKLTSLTAAGVTYNGATSKADRAFNGCEVRLGLTMRGYAPTRPQSYLNEARLSALGLSIYLAGRQVCAATVRDDTPRIMVLDDVLIGLDQSNRMPVLELLKNRFPDWQIVLLTYDRVWFEMARSYLGSSPGWTSMEMFEETEPSGVLRPVLRPQKVDPVASNLDKARRFHAAHEYAAAAVHARVAFELSLKRFSNKRAIPVRYYSDQKNLKSNDILSSIKTWLDLPSRNALKIALSPLIDNVELWRTVVLNPFSHSTPVNLTSVEVMGAIDAVEALHAELQIR